MRGVSEIVGAMLLLLIAVTMGTAMYIFFYEQLSMQRTTIEQSTDRLTRGLKTDFTVVHYLYNSSLGVLTLYVYNGGELEVRLDRVYIDSRPFNVSRIIYVDEIEEIEINITLDPGEYRLTIVTVEGYKYEGWIKV